MTNEELITWLVEKKRQKKLAPFYIIQNHRHLSQEDMHSWMHQLLNQLLKSDHRPLSLELDHPLDLDTLVLSTKDKQYKVEHIHKTLKQLQYDSFNRQHRYWIIKDAHKFTPLIANKWLKTLEENPKDSTIFLLDSRLAPLLPTMKSRGVLLRLKDSRAPLLPHFPENQPFELFLQEYDPELGELWDPKLPLHQLIQTIQNHQKIESFTQAILQWNHRHLTTFEQCQEFLQFVTFLQEHRDFHGLKQTLLAQLIHYQREGEDQRSAR